MANAGLNQTLRKPPADRFCDGLEMHFEFEQLDAPIGQSSQCLSCQRLLRVARILVDQKNLLGGSWREKQRIAPGLEILPEIVREIEIRRQVQGQVSV